jgi:sulfite exporter TauE/SafE
MGDLAGLVRRGFWRTFDFLLLMNPFMGVAMVLGGVILVSFGIRFSDKSRRNGVRDTASVVAGILLVAAGILPWLHRFSRHLPPFARDFFD